MKKILSILAVIALNLVSAQNSAVTNASLYREEGNLPEAKKEIDKAILNEKTKIDPKAWYYKGVIYTDIFMSKDPAIKMLSDSANGVALTALQKSIALENKEKGTYTKMSKDLLETVWALSINEGVGNFEAKDMAKAKRNFQIASQAKPSDSVAANNVLVACQYLKDTLCIIESYKKSLDAGKPRAEYFLWSFLYHQNKDTTKAYGFLNEGMNKFPSNKIFVQNYIEVLFAANKFTKLKPILEDYVEKTPEDKIAKLKLALTYESFNDLDNASAQYEAVLATEPTNRMALHNLGVIKYRKALIYFNQKDDLKPEERATKGKELDGSYKKALYDSAKYFEEHRKNNPNDAQVKDVLMDIYKRLKRDDLIQTLK